MRMTIGEAIGYWSDRDPHGAAVTESTADGRTVARTLSRRELDELSDRYAVLLLGAGVRPDDFVSIRLPNSLEFVLAAAAAWKVGATVQPLSHRFALAEQRAVVELADSRVVVGARPAEFPGRATIAPGIASGRTGEEELPAVDAVARAVLDAHPAGRSWKAPTSSGSTGRPKIVVAQASAHIDPTAQVATFIPQRAVQLVAGPLYHSAPFTYAMRGLMTGHRLVLLPAFDPTATLAAVAGHGVTWAMLVPTMMHRIWRLGPEAREGAELHTLESVLHIGAPCASWLKRAWIEWIGAGRVVEVYAGSESSGLTMITGEEWLARPGSVGRAVGGSRVRIVDEDGAEVLRGRSGLIELTREGGTPYRYLGAESRRRDGWDTLGDIGRMDEDGYLWVLDRSDDLITSGGISFYPIEVEQALEQHPAVRSAAVRGVPDEERGQRVHAVVDTEAEGLDAAVLLEWLRARLDAEKLPRSWVFVREPLRDDAGKLRRRDV